MDIQHVWVPRDEESDQLCLVLDSAADKLIVKPLDGGQVCKCAVDL